MTDRFHRRIAIALTIVLAVAWANILWGTPIQEAVVIVTGADGSKLTGVVVQATGNEAIVATNWHLFRDSPNQQAYVHAPGHAKQPAKTLWTAGENASVDLAILQVRGTKPYTAAILADEAPSQGVSVRTLGYPGGSYEQRELTGTVIGYHPGDLYLLCTMPTVGGESGAAVVDDQDRLVGISWGNDGQMYANNLLQIKRTIETVCRGGVCRSPRSRAVIVRPPRPMVPVIRPVAPPVTPPQPQPEYVTKDQLAALEQRILARLDTISAKQGEPGVQGPQGIPGATGADGAPGQDGQPGRDADAVALQQMIDEQITQRLSEIRGTIRIPIRATAGN